MKPMRRARSLAAAILAAVVLFAPALHPLEHIHLGRLPAPADPDCTAAHLHTPRPAASEGGVCLLCKWAPQGLEPQRQAAPAVRLIAGVFVPAPVRLVRPAPPAYAGRAPPAPEAAA